MNRDQFRSLYRSLRSKARRAQAGRPENIEGVFIHKDGIQVFDNNWPSDRLDVMSARSVMWIVPEHSRNVHSPVTTVSALFCLLNFRDLAPHARRAWVTLLRSCPPIPLPR